MASTKKDTAHIYFFYNPCQPPPVGEIKVNTIGFGRFGGVLSGFDGDFLLFPSLPIPAWTPPSPLQIPAVVLFSTRALGVLFLWHVPTAQESRVNRCPVCHCVFARGSCADKCKNIYNVVWNNEVDCNLTMHCSLCSACWQSNSTRTDSAQMVIELNDDRVKSN